MTDLIQDTTTTSNVPSITVYWLNESRADRILLLLEELELSYVIEKIDRGSDKLALAELKKIHSLGKSPVIKDGDRVVAESGFIIDYLIDYLIEKYGKNKNLKPTDQSWAKYSKYSYSSTILVVLILVFVLVLGGSVLVLEKVRTCPALQQIQKIYFDIIMYVFVFNYSFKQSYIFIVSTLYRR
jgi:hypothetical protein